MFIHSEALYQSVQRNPQSLKTLANLQYPKQNSNTAVLLFNRRILDTTATPSKRPKPLQYEIIDYSSPQQRKHKRNVMRHPIFSHGDVECRRQGNADGITGVHPPQTAPISTDVRTKGEVSVRRMPYDNRHTEPNGPTNGGIANVEKEMDRQIDEQLNNVA